MFDLSKKGVDGVKKEAGGILSWLIRCLQGAIVGTGAILPGVSGGVLCVAFGIYEPMMALLSHPIRSFREYYRMFIPILLGWAAGFVLLAGLVEKLFETAASVALMLFAGLIFGTVPELLKKSERSDGRQSWTPFIASMVLFYLLFSILAGGEGITLEPNSGWYFFCGLVWGLSIVIPGLSSSSLLIYLGLYQPMTGGIAALDFSVILPLLCGMFVTILLTARLVNRLFQQNYALVSRLVTGILISSTLLILPTSFETAGDLAAAVGCFVVGFFVARAMDAAQAKSPEKEIPT